MTPMRAAVYYSNRDVRIEERPVPKIGPGEILIRMKASGICGSDVMEWYRIRKAPLVLGHEMTGEIVEVGAGVTGYRTGQRVFAAHHVPCNTCRHCLTGHHTACETLHTTNYDPGGFAEYIRVPALNVDRGVFALPDEMTCEDGVFIEPLACVLRAQRTAKVRPAQSVLVLGSGLSGILHILLARAAGAGRVLATDIHPDRRKAAVRFGADAAIDPRENVPDRVREINGGHGVDLAVVCAGAPAAFAEAMKCVDRGGKVLWFATTEPGVEVPVPVCDLWRNDVTLLPSYGSSPLDNAAAMELIRAGRIPVRDMVSHRLPLSRAAEGFRLVADGGTTLKVILHPDSGAPS
ncbi:MAG TPA: alcohol dehydrogenase catalytic domain-containing protein [Syntrophales bacterium]|nr:alcohol dehydrogenase catalytic domain-containing protein [Syntrophales bacterium]